MKKLMITLMVTLLLGTGLGFSQYYGNEDAYDNDGYNDYEYRLSDAEALMQRYQGPIYYFQQSRANVYFVLIGNETYIVPAVVFQRYMYRHNFVYAPQDRFISLSCCGLDYYDNYLRFNFYFNYYQNNGWDYRYHSRLRINFRDYYSHRRDHGNYDRERSRIMGNNHNNYGNHNYYGNSNRYDTRNNRSYDNTRTNRYENRNNRSYENRNTRTYDNTRTNRYDTQNNRTRTNEYRDNSRHGRGDYQRQQRDSNSNRHGGHRG